MDRKGVIMKKFDYVIQDQNGIHARPAGLLVKEARKYESRVVVRKDGKEASADSIIGLMGLGAKRGDRLEIEISGNDEEAACTGLEAFLQANL